jgi:hypothetical protein
MRLIIAVVASLGLAAVAYAQSNPTDQSQPPAGATETQPGDAAAPNSAAPPPAGSETQAQPPAATAMPRGGRQPDPKRVVCRSKARQQGVRGQQLRDSIQVCVEEARLACTKKAIAQRLEGPQRREFIRNCTG